MVDVRERAAALPENGVPDAVRVLLPVVLEKSRAPAGDVNAQQVHAVCELAEQARQAEASEEARPPVHGLQVTTGSRMLDQFEPWYFGVAFAYLFKYCTGLPDAAEWSKKPRWRRAEHEPRVDLGDWVRIMARRVESQLGRNWVFGFATWNVLSRSAVNLSRTVYVLNTPVYEAAENNWRRLTAADIEKASMELLAALAGHYTDSSGRSHPVNGDMTKVGRVQNMSSTAMKLLRSISQTAQHLPGTQEARRHMRHDIEAMRVRFGLPLFVTFSRPTKRINCCMFACVEREPATRVGFGSRPKQRKLAGAAGHIRATTYDCPSRTLLSPRARPSQIGPNAVPC